MVYLSIRDVACRSYYFRCGFWIIITIDGLSWPKAREALSADRVYDGSGADGWRIFTPLPQRRLNV